MAMSRVRLVAVLAVACVPAVAVFACGTPASPQCPTPAPPPTVTVVVTASTCPSATTSVATTPTEVPPLEEGEATGTACAASLDECPVYGCATDTDKQNFNTLKRTRKDAKKHAITAQNATPITIATLVKLQQKVNGPKKNDFSADSRKLPASIDVDGQKLGEGMAVRIAGFMLDDPSPNKGV